MVYYLLVILAGLLIFGLMSFGALQYALLQGKKPICRAAKTVSSACSRKIRLRELPSH
jgi:hypothetical protein